jgi:hypothetical protein
MTRERRVQHGSSNYETVIGPNNKGHMTRSYNASPRRLLAQRLTQTQIQAQTFTLTGAQSLGEDGTEGNTSAKDNSRYE